MICYQGQTWCGDAGQCATMDCHRRLTEWHGERANRLDMPVAWASFREACKEYKPLAAKEASHANT
jgi:hypothetical protein